MPKRRKKNIFYSEPKRRPSSRRERVKRSKRGKRKEGYATQTMREAWTP